MYVPAHFEESRIEVLHPFIREHPIGTLVTLGPDGLNANHLPFELDPTPEPLGTLRGHVTRANAVWREGSSIEALVIFQGVQAYVTPSWYEAKKLDGKVVPTHNYVVVHAYGPLKAIDDPEWLRGLVGRLTTRFETGRSEPWRVTDAPAEFVEKQLRGIVGLEIPLTRLVGKWKVSQNRSEADREGVVRGLLELGDLESSRMAQIVQERSKPSEP